MDKLDSKSSLNKVEKARKMVDKALSKYGDPTMTLAELRAVLDRELQGISLSELIIIDRQKGW